MSQITPDGRSMMNMKVAAALARVILTIATFVGAAIALIYSVDAGMTVFGFSAVDKRTPSITFKFFLLAIVTLVLEVGCAKLVRWPKRFAVKVGIVCIATIALAGVIFAFWLANVL